MECFEKVADLKREDTYLMTITNQKNSKLINGSFLPAEEEKIEEEIELKENRKNSYKALKDGNFYTKINYF